MRSRPDLRVLAIDPYWKGFGHAVFDILDTVDLVDYGLAYAGSENARVLRHIDRFLRLYGPDVLAIEDARARGSLRQPRVRRLLDQVAALAKRRGVRCRRVSERVVQRAFGGGGTERPYDVAVAIAERYPEFAHRLPKPPPPPPRSASAMPHDARIHIFNAAALALTHIRASERPRDCADLNHQAPSAEDAPHLQ